MTRGRIVGIGFNVTSAADSMTGLERILGRMESAGASHAELSLFGLDLVANGRVIPAQRDRLVEVCRRFDLDYTAHGPLCMNLMDAEHFALHHRVIRAHLELCNAVGATVFVHHPGFPTSPSSKALDAGLRRERDTLADLAEIARAYGVTIAIENLFATPRRPFALDPCRLAREVEAIGHPNVGATLDVGHAYVQSTIGGFAYHDAVAALAPWVRHIHLHDQFGKPATMECVTDAESVAYGMGDLHLPPGWGDLPLDDIMAEMPLESDVVMIVELSPRFHSEMEACYRAAERLAAVHNERRAAA